MIPRVTRIELKRGALLLFHPSERIISFLNEYGYQNHLRGGSRTVYMSVLLKKGLARRNPDKAAGQPHRVGDTAEPKFDTLSDPDEMTVRQKRRYYS